MYRLPLIAIGLLTATATHAQTDLSVRPDCGKAPACFATITDALAAADRETSARWLTIRVAAGDYAEKLTIRRANVRLIGAGVGHTRLHFGAVAETAAMYDRNKWGTAGSATLTIAATDVTIDSLTIENDFDHPANDALSAGDPRKVSASQAVAVALDIASDRVLFDRVAMFGYQDTLLTRGRRAVIRNSLVAGNVDFIFGNGMLLIEDSEIRTRRRGTLTTEGGFASFITAPSTPIAQPVGIVSYRSRLTREAEVADASIALGRPWHPTTRFADGRYADPNAIGQAVFIDCTMDAHIHPDGWTSMSGTARDGSKTAVFRPQESRFADVGSRGPGARRRDIGIRWKQVPTIAEVRRIFAKDWPAFTVVR